MSDLTYTLLTDGSSDDALRPIVEWLLQDNGVSCAIQGEWADLRRLPRPPRGLVARLEKAVELYPCNLLFIHRDAENDTRESREREIRQAVAEARFDRGAAPIWVCVIPIRMMEAWLLFDERAIRRAAGNPYGRIDLDLPALGHCEDLPDPKSRLAELLRQASELGARRRAKLRIGPMVRRIAEYATDFRRLRELPAFADFERDLQAAIRTNGWDRR